MERKVVFLDRDGVINIQWKCAIDTAIDVQDREKYVLSWRAFNFIPGSKHAIRKLLEAGYVVVVVTNQACVGKGYVSEKDLKNIMAHMWASIVPINIGRGYEKHHSYVCPHTDKDGCSCRKPKPGLIYTAAFQHGLCLKEAWMVGDTRDDMRAGWAATIRKLILINPEVSVLEPSPKRRFAQPTVAPSLAIAATYIVSQDEKHENSERR